MICCSNQEMIEYTMLYLFITAQKLYIRLMFQQRNERGCFIVLSLVPLSSCEPTKNSKNCEEK